MAELIFAVIVLIVLWPLIVAAFWLAVLGFGKTLDFLGFGKKKKAGGAMKTIAVFAVALGLTGCVSTTRSYDASGNLLGSCTATRAFFLGSDAVCTGSSNPKDQGEASKTPPAEHRKDPRCPEGESVRDGSCYPIKPIFGSPTNK